ncbi:MAG: response regulator, partial [Candidatus Dadabacteria bacterium]
MERILVVEDDWAMLETCSQVLSRAGYDVHAVSSGREAEEILKTSAIDVVITDLKMPEVGG